VRPHAPSLYAGAVPLDPAAWRRQERTPAGCDPGPAALASGTAEGLQFRPTLSPFRGRRLQCRRNSNDPGGGPRRTLLTLRALQRDRLGGLAARRKEGQRTGEARPTGAQDQRSRSEERRVGKERTCGWLRVGVK